MHVLVGPPRHGVVRHGQVVAEAGTGQVHASPEPPDPGLVAGRRVIVQFTDRLFGTDAVHAAAVLDRMLAGADRRVVVLHDLPQISDGAAWDRRRAGYARVVACADVVVVSSQHEARLLADLAPGVRPVVIPLPIDPSPYADRAPSVGAAGRAAADPVVGVLGYLYPGKGLEQVIDAVAGLSVRVVNLGTVAAGHEDLLPALAARARAQDIDLTITGWLADAELGAALTAVDVPVAPHQHLSASGSINTWLAAGRRPIAPESSYATELVGRMPGSLRVVAGPGQLRRAIQDAIVQPALTWLDQVAIGPSSAQVAARLEALA
ncbi:hypothetical protein AZH51_03755 [Branchiibius sp. NY16-3462-2]|nr:hypothetical protein AZH51_03755 [Branchiibius sp. NY16-3462-2]